VLLENTELCVYCVIIFVYSISESREPL